LATDEQQCTHGRTTIVPPVFLAIDVQPEIEHATA
jgi:hypothetical protein